VYATDSPSHLNHRNVTTVTYMDCAAGTSTWGQLAAASYPSGAADSARHRCVRGGELTGLSVLGRLGSGRIDVLEVDEVHVSSVGRLSVETIGEPGRRDQDDVGVFSPAKHGSDAL